MTWREFKQAVEEKLEDHDKEIFYIDVQGIEGVNKIEIEEHGFSVT